MKWTRWCLAAVLGAGVLGLVGCEWDMAGDEDTWDDSMSWANFSGTYRSAGTSVVISNTAVAPTGSGSLAEIRDEIVGIGNGISRTFSGTVDGRPIYKGTFSITDGEESFEDDDEDGILTGSKGGTGAINYDTGVFTVNFLLQPGAGVEIRATYIYYVGENGPVDDGGGTTTTKKSISRITVTQEGNVLTFVDDDGERYTGKMGRVSTVAGDTSGSTSGQVVGNFEVKGVNNGITIVGTFEALYAAAETVSGTSPTTSGGGTVTMTDMRMRGTWIKGKDTGGINFVGPGS